MTDRSASRPANRPAPPGAGPDDARAAGARMPYVRHRPRQPGAAIRISMRVLRIRPDHGMGRKWAPFWRIIQAARSAAQRSES